MGSLKPRIKWLEDLGMMALCVMVALEQGLTEEITGQSSCFLMEEGSVTTYYRVAVQQSNVQGRAPDFRD